MSNNQKKKVFPKIKKKLKGFLTDESGKITKKDALGLAVGGVLLSGVDDVNATTIKSDGWEGDVKCNHSSGIVNGHYSSTPSSYLSGHGSHGSHSSHGSHGSRR